MRYIGITERGDAALDTSWLSWIKSGEKAILITKNFASLARFLEPKIDNHEVDPMNIIVHATVTGYAGTLIEPNVPVPDWNWINNGKRKLGLADLVLRVDPIIPTKDGTKVAIDVINNFTNNVDNNRIRISFIDNYNHLASRGMKLPWTGLHAPISMREDAYNEILNVCNKFDYTCEVCGEPGFVCRGCVSDLDLQSFGVLNNPEYSADISGYQRAACKCLGNKKELLNNRHQCAHKCVYCYWR